MSTARRSSDNSATTGADIIKPFYVYITIALVLTIISLDARARTPSLDDTVSIYEPGELLTSQCRAFLTAIKQNNRTTAQEAHDGGLCYGFVVGVLDSIASEELEDSRVSGFNRLCLPHKLNGNSATEIVARFIDIHPEIRTDSGYEIVRTALSGVFSCQ